MSENVIEIRNIIRDFKLGQETVHVLKGIDLDIKRGDYVAIMGPSGSGKSTLIDIILGLLTPKYGALRIGGTTVNEENAFILRTLALPKSVLQYFAT